MAHLPSVEGAIQSLAERYRDELRLFKAIDAYSALIEVTTGEVQQQFLRQRCRLLFAVGYVELAHGDLVALGFSRAATPFQSLLVLSAREIVEDLAAGQRSKALSPLFIVLCRKVVSEASAEISHPFAQKLFDEGTRVAQSGYAGPEIFDLLFALAGSLSDPRKTSGFGTASTTVVLERLGTLNCSTNPYALGCLIRAEIAYVDEGPPDFVSAIRVSRAALAISPDNAILSSKLALHFAELGRHTEALELLSRSAGLLGNDFTYYQATIPYLVRYHGVRPAVQYVDDLERSGSLICGGSASISGKVFLLKAMIDECYLDDAHVLCQRYLDTAPEGSRYSSEIEECSYFSAVLKTLLRRADAEAAIVEFSRSYPDDNRRMMLRILYEYSSGDPNLARRMYEDSKRNFPPREHLVGDTRVVDLILIHTARHLENSGLLESAKKLLSDFEYRTPLPKVLLAEIGESRLNFFN